MKPIVPSQGLEWIAARLPGALPWRSYYAPLGLGTGSIVRYVHALLVGLNLASDGRETAAMSVIRIPALDMPLSPHPSPKPVRIEQGQVD